ncbi:MAG: hypothetical protein K6U89_14920 [Chloroflexi bacterium]|nr:hypothetical protein [Chloroflexota bacterium]
MQRHFSDGTILEIAVVIAVLTGMAKLLFALDLGEREEYCPFPGHSPGGWQHPTPPGPAPCSE